MAIGPIPFLTGNNAFRLRLIGDLWRWCIAAAAMIALVCVVGQSLPALALWAIVVAILAPVVVVETRARIRGAALIP